MAGSRLAPAGWGGHDRRAARDETGRLPVSVPFEPDHDRLGIHLRLPIVDAMELVAPLGRHKRMRPALVLATVIVLAGGGCGDPAPGEATTPSGPRAELESARARWVEAAPATYSFVFTDDCGECDPALREPRPVAIWDGEELDPGDLTPTVEEMFSEIERAIDAGLSVEVVYHPDLGAPLDVAIEMEARPRDGGTHWVVEQLTPGLPGDDVAVAEVEAARDRWRSTRPHAYAYTVDVFCDCPFEGSLRTEVDGDRVVGWNHMYEPSDDVTVVPLTIDELFEGVLELAAAGEGGVADEGFRFEGAARFDRDLGYPVWIGLDVTLLDDELRELGFPDRIVFSISDLEPLPGTAGNTGTALEQARERWEGLALDSYTYELTVHDVAVGDFTGPYLVTVLGGEVVAITLDGEPADRAQVPGHTIEGLFDLVDRQLSAGRASAGLYDHELGYPVLVESDREGEMLSITDVRAHR